MAGKMSVDDLIKEYENFIGMKLTEKEKIIFKYAYIIGSKGLDNKET